MRVSQVKRNGAGQPVIVASFTSSKNQIALLIRSGVIDHPRSGGMHQSKARSPKARLSLIRKTLAKMKADGRIITPIDEVVL